MQPKAHNKSLTMRKLRARFVYSSNGKQTYELNLETGKANYINFYPTPAELGKSYAGEAKNINSRFRL